MGLEKKYLGVSFFNKFILLFLISFWESKKEGFSSNKKWIAFCYEVLFFGFAIFGLPTPVCIVTMPCKIRNLLYSALWVYFHYTVWSCLGSLYFTFATLFLFTIIANMGTQMFLPTTIESVQFKSVKATKSNVYYQSWDRPIMITLFNIGTISSYVTATYADVLV